MSETRREPASTGKLPTSGSWKPGQSGNPKGRPRESIDIQMLCRQHAGEAVAALVRGLKLERHAVAAATQILDRAYGKPVQAIEAKGDVTHFHLHLIAAQLVGEEIVPAPPPLIEAQPEPQGDLLDQPTPTE